MSIDNSQDVIDSRDIIARILELEAERGESIGGADDVPDEEGNFPEAGDAWDDTDEGRELATLRALAEEAAGYASDWNYGEALIRDSYFEDYAREMLEDCGEIPRDLPHYIVIDWEATAKNIQQDYMDVNYDGVTYWVRCS